MGFKRPMDSDVPELPFKHSRVSEHENFRPSLVGTLDGFTGKPDISAGDEGCIGKFDCRIGQANIAENEVPVSPDKDVENSAPLSWVTTSSSDEESGYDSLFPECFDFGLSGRLELPLEDIHVPLTNAPPRKEVPIGPDHQATLPEISTCTLEWSEKEEKFIGTCIIPMSSIEFSSTNVGAGVGRTDCFCSDKGSASCVRQHIMEAREKLSREFGGEVFENLGFNDMGEVVAARWSDEEERLFHEVVFSNPYFLGRNFWNELSEAFPSRSKKEIVSYYFNVFMLRRRAAQNRLDFLEIDSDDDEWHENEDLSNESSTDVEDQTQCEETFPNEDDDDSDDDNYSNNDRDGDLGNGVIVPTKKDIGVDNYSDANTGMSSEKGTVNSVGQHADTTSGGLSDYFDLQDDSGTSFEFNMDDSCGTDDARAGSQGRGDETYRTGCLSSRIDDFSSGANHPYMFDACDAKIWHPQYQTGPSNDVDLLPTSNIIEEIFGEGSWDSKPMDE